MRRPVRPTVDPVTLARARPVFDEMRTEVTVGQYLDVLTQTMMVRQLLPWHENLAKRQVKSPKIYFRDTGLLHALMDVLDAAGDDEAALEAALRELATGLSDDDLNGLGDLGDR